MQARLSYVRFPSLLIALFVAISVAVILGGVLGYELKSPTIVPGPTRLIVEQPAPSAPSPCYWTVSEHKAC